MIARRPQREAYPTERFLASLRLTDVKKLRQRFMAGYNAMPDKTVEAWRNFWFHTGDAGVMSPDGVLTFVDRMKDCIRRRGENISSFEVEEAMRDLDGVKEVAAFAVPSDIPGAEEEVMIMIVPHDGASLTASQVAIHARAHLPRFALPRYLEFARSLPKTPTEKVQKQALRQRGVTADTVDLTSDNSRLRTRDQSEAHRRRPE